MMAWRWVVAAVGLVVNIGAWAQASSVGADPGQLVSSAQIDEVISARVKAGAADTPELRGQVREQLLERMVALREARAEGLEQKVDVQKTMRAAQDDALLRAYVGAFEEAHPVTEAQIQQAYSELKDRAGAKEYHLRAILVTTQADGAKVLERLHKGEVFADVAKRFSGDEASRVKGGDLGWVAQGMLSKDVQAVTSVLAKGKFSDAVKVDKGYGIFYLEDVRPVMIPPLEKIQAQLTQQVEEAQLRSHVQDLIKTLPVQ